MQPEYHHNSEISLLRRNPSAQLQWCSELKFMDKSSPHKLKTAARPTELQTFPKFSNSLNLDATSSTIGDTKNEFNQSEKAFALASFPGSGNTWLRYLLQVTFYNENYQYPGYIYLIIKNSRILLLQQATGIYTGSVYKDYGLLKSGFPAESISNSSVLIVKTHEFGPKAWAFFKKAVLLVRDPAKAILAEFNRQSGGHVGFASIDRYKRTNGRYWMKFVHTKLINWQNTNLAWGLNFTGDVLIVYYEDLVDNVEKTLRDILNFLNFKINEELLSCAVKRKEGIYRRKKRLLNFEPFTTSMRKMIEKKRIQVYEELGRNKLKN